MRNKIKLMIVDDHKLFRDGLMKLLNDFTSINVMAEAANGLEALQMVEMCNPDVIFMDIDMPVMNGKEATILLKKQHPHIKVIVLSQHNDPYYTYDFMKNGADGYLKKDINLEILIEAIETVFNGGLYLDEQTTKALEISTDLRKPLKCIIDEISLNGNEVHLLRLICMGKPNKEISDILEIPLSTFNHRKSILKEKTECKSDIDLVFYAFRHGIVKYFDNF